MAKTNSNHSAPNNDEELKKQQEAEAKAKEEAEAEAKAKEEAEAEAKAKEEAEAEAKKEKKTSVSVKPILSKKNPEPQPFELGKMNYKFKHPQFFFKNKYWTAAELSEKNNSEILAEIVADFEAGKNRLLINLI